SPPRALGATGCGAADTPAPPPPPAAAPAPAAAPPAATPAPAAAAGGETGLAAVYNHRLNGHKTATRERYDATGVTAGHKTLPFGTMVKVTNVKNQKMVTVRIN